MSHLRGLRPNAKQYLKNLNVVCILHPCSKYMMVALTPRWKYSTDASAKALGAVLLQKCAAAKHFHPIAYYSKKFNNI